MNTPAPEATEAPVINTSKEATAEEKFFGVQTTIHSDVEPLELSADEPVDTSAAQPRDPDTGQFKAKPDELEEYGDKVQKRIKHLTWQQHEERRMKEAAERERDEAVRVAQHLHGQNQQFQDTLNSGEATLVANVQQRAKLAVEAASAGYAKAHEEGDTEALLKAQQALITAQAEQREAEHYGFDYEQRAQQYAAWRQQQIQQNQLRQQQYQRQQQQQAQQQAQQQQQQRQVPKPSDRSVAWAKDNPWFGHDKHKDMTALAYGVHETLVRERGIEPDSDEYFTEIDRTMRSRFADYFEPESKPLAGGSPATTTVVAPATRSTGGAPRSQRLNAHQVKLAKKLGISNKQYAEAYVQQYPEETRNG